MTLTRHALLILSSAALLSAAAGHAGAGTAGEAPVRVAAGSAAVYR